jgi:hypothetical protein
MKCEYSAGSRFYLLNITTLLAHTNGHDAQQIAKAHYAYKGLAVAGLDVQTASEVSNESNRHRKYGE